MRNLLLLFSFLIISLRAWAHLGGISGAVSVQNLFNTQWKETQFATESRLKDESEPVEEIHFTPGEPFSAKLGLTLFFCPLQHIQAFMTACEAEKDCHSSQPGKEPEAQHPVVVDNRNEAE